MNPSTPAAMDGGDRLGARRVDHALEAKKSQATGHVTVLEPRVIGCRVTASKSQHSQPLGGHALDGFVRLRFVERDQFAVIIEGGPCSAR